MVAMAHPHLEPRLAAGPIIQARQQGVPGHDFHFGMAEFALVGRLGGPAQLRGHGLHAVADAEHRHPGVEHRLRRARR